MYLFDIKQKYFKYPIKFRFTEDCLYITVIGGMRVIDFVRLKRDIKRLKDFRKTHLEIERR